MRAQSVHADFRGKRPMSRHGDRAGANFKEGPSRPPAYSIVQVALVTCERPNVASISVPAILPVVKVTPCFNKY
jgi:hypothetical protein